MLSYYLSNLARKHWQRERGFKACILYSSSMGCDVFARLPQTDERRMVSHTTTTVKLLCKRWQQLKRKACNYLRSIAPPRRRIAPRGRGWAEQQYEQQGGVDGGSITVHMIHMVHIMVHILSRWGKHYGVQHILSRGCKQVELRRVRQQFCKYAILTITIIPRGFSMICIISVENKLG